MNSYGWLMGMRGGGAVRRYHTARMARVQTVADHSWGVAVCLLAAGLATGDVMTAALLHDMAESVTGDVPAPAKWESASLNQALMRIESQFNMTHGIHCMETLTELEVASLNWADTFELCCWTLEEFQMGNRLARDIFARGSGKLPSRLEDLRAASATDESLKAVASMNQELLGEYEHASGK